MPNSQVYWDQCNRRRGEKKLKYISIAVIRQWGRTIDPRDFDTARDKEGINTRTKLGDTFREVMPSWNCTNLQPPSIKPAWSVFQVRKRTSWGLRSLSYSGKTGGGSQMLWGSQGESSWRREKIPLENGDTHLLSRASLSWVAKRVREIIFKRRWLVENGTIKSLGVHKLVWRLQECIQWTGMSLPGKGCTGGWQMRWTGGEV